MAITTPDELVYPDAGQALAPLEAHFAALAESVQAAISDVRASTAPAVPNAAARNTLYPSPVQGNRVYRSDLGYEEAYYGLYHVTTNPGGRVVAGWYPSAPRGVDGIPFAMAAGIGSNATGAAPDTNFPVGRFTKPPMVVAVNTGNSVSIMNVQAITKDKAKIAGYSSGGTAAATNWMWIAVQMEP